MSQPYQNTISGLLRKRSELMGDAQRLREQLAHVGNDIEALDRTLISLGYEGDLKALQPRGNRIVFFARDELIGLEGKDCHDRRLRNDMVRRKQGFAASEKGAYGRLNWRRSGTVAT